VQRLDDVSVTGELEALRAQVRELADREAIRQLTAEYMQAMHDARWDDALGCFAPDATYDHGILGELRTPEDLRQFYLEFMPAFEQAGGWAFDVLADPVIHVRGDGAEGRWFLLTLLVDPDSKEAAWSMCTLEYEYVRRADRWYFLHNRCIHEHLLAPYARGWGASGGSRVPSQAGDSPDPHFERLRRQGGKQSPGRLCRSIRGWTVPTLEP
jgi:hypothetical protein